MLWSRRRTLTEMCRRSSGGPPGGSDSSRQCRGPAGKGRTVLEAPEQHCMASGRGGGETQELRGLSWGEGWIGTLRGCAGGPGVRRLGPTPSLPLQLGEERPLGFRRPRSQQDLPQPRPRAWARATNPLATAFRRARRPRQAFRGNSSQSGMFSRSFQTLALLTHKYLKSPLPHR